MWIFGRQRTIGAMQMPQSGGVLLVANHISDADPVALQCAFDRPIFFMAAEELFQMKKLEPIIRWFGTFPVKRGTPDREALRIAIEHLKMGEVVCVFPEGALSADGELMLLQPGVILISEKTKVPILPVGLINTDGIVPYGSTTPRISRRKVRVNVGQILPASIPKSEVLCAIEASLRTLLSD